MVVVVQFRRARRRPAMVDDQQQPTGTDDVCGLLEDPRAIQWQGGVQELSRHQVEGTFGETLGKVVRLELDPVPTHPRTSASSAARCNAVSEMSTATTCQPRSASHMACAALTTPQIQWRYRVSAVDDLRERGINPPTPHTVTFAVVLLPVLLGIRR